MITLNSSQIEVLQDFISIGSTLQTEVARFFSAEARLEKKNIVFLRQFGTLKENFSYCGLGDVSGCLGHLAQIIGCLEEGRFTSTANVSEAVQQSFDCLIAYGQNLLDGEEEGAECFFLDTPLRYLSASRGQDQAEEAAQMILLGIIQKHSLPRIDCPTFVAPKVANRELSDVLTAPEVAIVRTLMTSQEERNPIWAGRMLFQVDLALKLNLLLGKPCNDRQLVIAECFHDIGMLFLPDSILLKPGSFDVIERESLKSHVRISSALVEMDQDLLEARQMIMEHHEEYGGGGYPNALKGDQICTGAQILMMCDVYYSLTHSRKDRPFEKSAIRALLKIKQLSGIKFSHDLVHAMTVCIENEFKATVFDRV